MKPNEKLRRLIDDSNETLDAATRGRVMQHIADAEFSGQQRTLEKWNPIGLDFSGQPHPSKPSEILTVGTKLSSLEWHTVKHVGQGEWQSGTTPQEYLADIRAAVLHATAVLDVGEDVMRYPGSSTTRQAPSAGVRTDVAKAKSDLKKVTNLAGKHIFTVYAVDTQKLRTSYQLDGAKAMAKVGSWSKHRTFP